MGEADHLMDFCLGFGYMVMSVPFAALSAMLLFFFRRVHDVTEVTGLITDRIIGDDRHTSQYSKLVLKISHPIINHILDENYQTWMSDKIRINNDQLDQYQVDQEIKIWHFSNGISLTNPGIGFFKWIPLFFGLILALLTVSMLAFSIFMCVGCIIQDLNTTTSGDSTVSSKDPDNNWQIIPTNSDPSEALRKKHK